MGGRAPTYPTLLYGRFANRPYLGTRSPISSKMSIKPPFEGLESGLPMAVNATGGLNHLL